MLQVGDRVRRRDNAGTNDGLSPGETGVVTSFTRLNVLVKHDKDGRIGDHDPRSLTKLEEASTKNTMTNLVKKFRLLAKSEPEKTFIEKGIMSEDESLTAEGKELFNVFMFEKHKAEFKTEVVDKLVDEDKK